MPKKNRILITGSSGMLGIDLCEELNGDYIVCGFDLSKNPGSKVKNFYKGDITDKSRVSAVISKVKPFVVIHAAAWTNVDASEFDKKKAYRINSSGTKIVALACKETGAILIYLSTDFVFDGRKKIPYRESDKPHPLNIYADSKLKGEEAVKKSIKKYFILRTSWLYGRHGANFVDTIIDKAKFEPELKVVRDQTGCPTYTKDMARAIHVLIDRIVKGQRSKFGIYHVCNSGSVSWYQYAKEILKLTGSGAKILPISSEELARAAKRPAMSVLDNSRFRAFTGYRMRNWKDALKDYLSLKKR